MQEARGGCRGCTRLFAAGGEYSGEPGLLPVAPTAAEEAAPKGIKPATLRRTRLHDSLDFIQYGSFGMSWLQVGNHSHSDQHSKDVAARMSAPARIQRALPPQRSRTPPSGWR